MNPRIRLRRPASIGSNQASPANSPCSAAALLLSLSMAWSPPALERRSLLVTQTGEHATHTSHPTRDGPPPVPLPRLWQAVQRALRHPAEPRPVPIRRHRPGGTVAPALPP